jgi:DNA-binding Lrp family transcriptional regulator
MAIVKLDKRDTQLLQLLRQDSRTPVSQLAQQLGISRDTVAYRLRRLEHESVILRHYAEIDRSVFGYIVCYVLLLLDERNQRKRKQLLHDIERHPNTEATAEYNGNWDMQWTLVVRHVEELDDILMRLAAQYKGVIIEKDTLIVVRWSRADGRGTTPPCPDERDIEILKLLAEDARLPALAIGERVGLSADAVIKRIKQLRSSGVIRRFTIATDVTVLGKQWHTFVLQMKHFDEEHQARLKEFVAQRPYIRRAFKTIGTWDVTFTLVADDAAHFHRVFKDIKVAFSDVVKSYDSFPGWRAQLITSLPRAIYERDEPRRKHAQSTNVRSNA